MRRVDREAVLSAVRQRFEHLAPFLPEQTRRLWAAAEALSIGRGGTAIVAEATAIARATLLRDLDHLIDPHTRGDPESPLRWTCKSTYQLAHALQQQGHHVSQRTVYTLLDALDYSLQANRKTE